MNNKTQIIPSDYQDYVYRLTYYLLRNVAPYIPDRIKPNQITVLAFISAMLGTGLLFFVKSPAAYLYWVIFNLIWFLLDALDGMHARLSNQSSEYGAFLDHALDNIYFVFMLTAFAYKFDLLHLLYVYIICLRITAALMVFTVQCHTKRLYLSKFTGGLEFVLLSTALILSYCYPHLNLALYAENPFLLKCINLLSLQQGVFMKLALLVYFIGVPINFVLQFRFVQKILVS
ncbi:MAG: CDP-alcohol phosphatidyltransferase family protein [Gammaproteobacteria bacterium]|nr:CDP-alcohol phosphatidyltransferase family protein [Gammaproteobacteria bacterium]